MPKLLPNRLLLLLPAVALFLFRPGAARAAVAAEAGEYLSDHPELILSSQQAWGELGWDVAAHLPGQAGAPLQIGDRVYQKGLGHHAGGALAVLLDGQFSDFDSELGLQPCGAGGSVIFRVIVDGRQRFESGLLRSTNAPQALHVSLAGAQELRLEADDAGDGITCDMANWAAARLTRAPGASARPTTTVDVARFARVVTWDPLRLDGARATRIEEFRAEDLFLENEVRRDTNGNYRVPVNAEGLGCIGLQWLNRRALRELALEFEQTAKTPATNEVQIQGWFGESAWQGSWKPLAGAWQVTDSRLVFRLASKGGVVQTQKVRWIFPGSPRLTVRELSAFTRSRWETVDLLVQTEQPSKRGYGEISVANGELLSLSQNSSRQVAATNWDLRRPFSLGVRYSRPSAFKSDTTVLQFHLPAGDVAVAVQDVLSNDCVYLPDFGLFVARDPAPVTFAEYKRRVAGRQTLLRQVRQLPDQTLAQAMARTHHEAQREGPVMLSLACDNTKFVLERDGTLRFPGSTNSAGDWMGTAGELRWQFDSQPGAFTRVLDGGWLPIPVITTAKDGLLWRERVFVAPADEPGSDPARLNRASVCVAEFTVSNSLPTAAQAALRLAFLANTREKQPVDLPSESGRIFQLGGTGLSAIMHVGPSCPLRFRTDATKAELTGVLPAGAAARLTVCLADRRVNLALLASRLERLRDETETYWQAVLAPAMQVETPEPMLNDLIRSSQVRCLIAARNEAGGARIAPWIAAMSYGPLESEANSVIRGMAFMGHEEFARRGLDFFIQRYNTNGFLTTGYTTFGTAWHLWTLGEYYQLYRDTNWLRRAAPEISRVGDWIVRQTEKTRRSGAPEFGLMPPGVLADWNAFACHFTMNAYYDAALRELAAALANLPEPEALKASLRFASAAGELRANILRAYRWTQSQSPALRLRDGTWIPAYPSQVHSPGRLADFFPGQDAGRSWCYDVELGAHQLVPAGVFRPADRETQRIMEHMEDVQFLADGWFDYPARSNEQDWFNLGGFSKVQPYYTRNCEVYALRDDLKPFVRSYFNTIAAMLNPEVMTFWEHFHHSGAWDKTHETGYFLHQTRTMLVMERGKDLWLAPLISTNWLADGKRLVVNNAPTRFGPVSYSLESQLRRGVITATIHPPLRRPPDEIVLRLPHPGGNQIRSVLLNGKKLTSVDKTTARVRLKPGDRLLTLQVSYEP